ncbi:MAG: hypothetical protein JNL33_06645 [Betaproteobacteria bacterium]|nr:hypothetical protein [Betaproteobacteria bacterium]
MLKPQDVLLLLKIVARGPEPWSYSQLAWELGMSASEVHAGVRRTAESGLLHVDQGWGVPDARGLDEFLVHGVRYVWAARPGGLVMGIPTGAAAEPLASALPSTGDPPTVWPDPDGGLRGLSIEPLYKSVPVAARRDPVLHELLALVDGIRSGPDRVRDLAVRQLRKRLGTSGAGVLSQVRTLRGGGAASTSNTYQNGKEKRRLHR